MNRLTKQEQFVLCAVFGLLLAGLAVKTWRTGQARVEPPPAAAVTTNSPATPM